MLAKKFVCERAALEKVAEIVVLEPFHNFADFLRAATGTEEQRVVRLDEYEIADADGGDKFLRTPEKVTTRIECE